MLFARTSLACLRRVNGVASNNGGSPAGSGHHLRSNPAHDEIGGQVDDERDREQENADDEQHLVVLRSDRRLAQLGRDGRGQGPHRIQHAGRNLHGVARGHQHRHGLADGAADAQQHRGQQAVLRRRQQHAVDQLPPRHAEREGRFAVGVGHGFQRVFADRHDDRHAHQRENDAAVQDVEADRRVEELA